MWVLRYKFVTHIIWVREMSYHLSSWHTQCLRDMFPEALPRREESGEFVTHEKSAMNSMYVMNSYGTPCMILHVGIIWVRDVSCAFVTHHVSSWHTSYEFEAYQMSSWRIMCIRDTSCEFVPYIIWIWGISNEFVTYHLHSWHILWVRDIHHMGLRHIKWVRDVSCAFVTYHLSSWHTSYEFEAYQMSSWLISEFVTPGDIFVVDSKVFTTPSSSVAFRMSSCMYFCSFDVYIHVHLIYVYMYIWSASAAIHMSSCMYFYSFEVCTCTFEALALHSMWVRVCIHILMHVYRPRSFLEAGLRPCIHSFVWFVPLTPN